MSGEAPPRVAGDGDTWARTGGDDDRSTESRTVAAIAKLQDSRALRRRLAHIFRRGDVEANRYAEYGVATFNERAGREEASRYE